MADLLCSLMVIFIWQYMGCDEDNGEYNKNIRNGNFFSPSFVVVVGVAVADDVFVSLP